MNSGLKGRILAYWKKETVQVVAGILAFGSCFFVPPSMGYLEYINFKVLILLFCLMSVVAGLKQIGVFDALCRLVLQRVHSVRGVMLLLGSLSFFMSMFLTNDVTLVTVVPFTIMIFGSVASFPLSMTLILETVAANLGSMLTPFGNPQNLFLYAEYEFGFVEFLEFMAPFTILSFLLVLVTGALLGKGELRAANEDSGTQGSPEDRNPGAEFLPSVRKKVELCIYIALFVLSILAVARILDVRILFALTLIAVGIMDYKLFSRVDYALLLTFVFFFIFVGNMGQMESVKTFLAGSMEGREILTAVLASQVISNVPAAVLLAQFTDAGKELVIGTNLGGLGTLIASMASLITYKFYAEVEGCRKGNYLFLFTAVNVAFLLLLAMPLWLGSF